MKKEGRTGGWGCCIMRVPAAALFCREEKTKTLGVKAIAGRGARQTSRALINVSVFCFEKNEFFAAPLPLASLLYLMMAHPLV